MGSARYAEKVHYSLKYGCKLSLLGDAAADPIYVHAHGGVDAINSAVAFGEALGDYGDAFDSEAFEEHMQSSADALDDKLGSVR